jgi:hypothetical protein
VVFHPLQGPRPSSPRLRSQARPSFCLTARRYGTKGSPVRRGGGDDDDAPAARSHDRSAVTPVAPSRHHPAHGTGKPELPGPEPHPTTTRTVPFSNSQSGRGPLRGRDVSMSVLPPPGW